MIQFNEALVAGIEKNIKTSLKFMCFLTNFEPAYDSNGIKPK
jgi:hypothetical protein